ncbi:MAG: hypothetical protein ACYTGS_07950 [Planctomycetota bacterium]|jgi:Tfp pilus assembly PilM family ATPase
MFGFTKNNTCPIGVEAGNNSLKLAQLDNNGAILIAGNSKAIPDDIQPGSSEWQKWAIKTVRVLATYGSFQGKQIIAAMPTGELFVDHMKRPKAKESDLHNAIFSRIKQRLPFESLQENTIMQYILTEEDNVLVMAMERRIVERHLAIYEKAGLSTKSIGVWPAALTNSYVRFFGRRECDFKTVMMLICIEADCTNVVVCRHKNLLLARSMPTGFNRFDDEQASTRLVMELSACKRQFSLLYQNTRIERLIFLSGQSVNKDVFAAIAKQLEMPAQMGDCLAAVKIAKSCRMGKKESGTGSQESRLNCSFRT